MRLERLHDVWLFLYFRGVAEPALRNPIGLAGIVGLAAHPSWAMAAVALNCLFISYMIPNELLFRDAARAKREVLSFLRVHRGVTFIRFPTEDFARHFDLSFLVPSYFAKNWLASRISRRVRVYLARTGPNGERAPASPRAYVSAVALDTHIFLRDSLAEMAPEVHFRLAHELGHASGIHAANAQRNVIGLTCVYFSLAWAVLISDWSWWFAGWTLLQLFGCLIASEAFSAFRRSEHFHAELAADYMATRHLAPHEVKELLDTGMAYALVQSDPALDAEQTAIRKRVLIEQMEARGRDEAIDIPSTYMTYSFQHPLILGIFAFLHLGYIVAVSILNEPTIHISLAFLFPVLVYFLISIWQDAYLQNAINAILDAGDDGPMSR